MSNQQQAGGAGKAGATKEPENGSGVDASAQEGPFVWKPPAMWGDEARAAVVDKFAPQEIHNDYLPASNEELELVRKLCDGVKFVPAAAKHLDDVCLLRFVRGFTLNQWAKLPVEEAIEKTVEVLTRAIEFYDHVGANAILARADDISRSYEYHKYWVNGVVGTDTFGRQIYLVHPPGSRLIKLFKGQEDLLLNHVVDMERLKATKRAEEAKRGLMLYKHVLILDGGITSMTMKRLMFMKNALEYKGTSIDSDFYPEMLYRAWIINAPLALRALWKMAAPFLNPITRAKFVVVGNVPLEKMAADGLTLDNLPEYLGGNAANPPGFHYREKVAAGKTFKRDWKVKKGDVVFFDMEMKGSYYMDIKVFNNTTELGSERIDEDKGVLFSNTLTMAEDGVFSVTMHNDGKWYGRTVSYDVRIQN